MNIFQRIATKAIGFLTPSGDAVNKLNQAVYSFFSGFFYTLTTNKKTYVDEGYRKNLDVYSIVKLIASKSADAKFTGVKYEGNEQKDLPPTDYINKILKRPNPTERQQQFVEEAITWLMLTGDIYIYKLRYISGPDKGKVNQLYLLPSQYVQIIGGGWLEPVKGYKLIIGDQEVEFTTDDVTHIKYFNPNWDISGSQLYGQSPLEAAINTIQSSNEATNAKIKAFLNGGVSGLLSSADPNMALSTEQIDHLNDKIREKNTGTNNAHRITATNGMVNYQQIGLSPADLEVLKSIQFDANQLCKVFGVDPILFDTNSSSYNNKKEAYKALVNNVVIPALNLLKDGLDDCFMEQDKGVAFSVAHFAEMQQDLGEMITSLEKAWWFTPNQKLEMMNREPSKDPLMNKVYIPSSYVPLDEVSVPMDVNLKNFDY